MGILVRRYVSLPLPKANAASNVHVNLMLCKLAKDRLGFFEKMKLKKKLTKRLALYDKTFNFVRQHGLDNFWPKEAAVLTPQHWEYIKTCNHLALFTLPQRYVLTPWVDARNLLVITMEGAGVTSQELDRMCQKELK